jgi:PleD family two-component response regulator
MGVAQWPGDAEELKTLIDSADQALYASKKGGRDRVTRFDAI